MANHATKPKPVYLPGQIALACFLGSPLAGCWLMARNYRAVEQKKKEQITINCGIVVTLVQFAVAYVAPNKTPHGTIPLIFMLGIFYAARKFQGPMIAEYQANGGKRGSWWMAVGIGLLGLVIVFAVIFAGVYFLPDGE